MSDDRERGPDIIDAHQELVGHIERGVRRMRVLAVLSVAVSAFLAVSYLAQLALPLTGTRTETVDLADPALVATELVVLGVALVWLYVGLSDLKFSSKMMGEIGSARAKEKEIGQSIA